MSNSDLTPTEQIESMLEFLSIVCGESVVISALNSYLLSRDKFISRFSSFCTD